MRKTLMIAVSVLLFSTVSYAQNLDLGGVDASDVKVPEVETPEVEVPEMEMPDTGNFPVGEWLDSNYNAVWTFTSGNIQLYTSEGSLVFDFEGKMEGFDLSGGMGGVTVSFSCGETARSYQFVKGVSNRDMTLIIDKDNGVHYETVMKMQ